MEQFTIHLSGQALDITPCEDGSGFLIHAGGEYKGKIFAQHDDAELMIWNTNDDIDPVLVELIGDKIDHKYM